MLLSAGGRNPFRRVPPKDRARRHRPNQRSLGGTASRASAAMTGGVDARDAGPAPFTQSRSALGVRGHERLELGLAEGRRRDASTTIAVVRDEGLRSFVVSTARDAARYSFLSWRLVSLWNWSLPAQQPIF